MEYINAIFFFFVILGFLWKMKADYLFVLFSFAAYLFLLFYIIKYSPLDLFLSVLNLFLVNPYGIFILVVPIAINCIYKQIKKRSSNSNSNSNT